MHGQRSTDGRIRFIGDGWLVVRVIVLVQCTAPLIEYVLVENGLKRKFDQNGNMRQ